jgi:hypothetical protein
MAKLLAIIIADFCVRGPQLGFNAAICGVLKVAEDDLLTRNAVLLDEARYFSAGRIAVSEPSEKLLFNRLCKPNSLLNERGHTVVLK